MNKTFYHFLMKFRDPKPKEAISQFANNAYEDHSFPKGASNYHELSTYLELNGYYLSSMTVFDQAWEMYINDAKHK